MSSEPAPPKEPQATETNAATGSEPAFGWNLYAERMNGRFAMIGFISVLLIEALTGQGLLTWMGLR
ncbi:MAG: chlorophyll a/b-binding protein [Geitlerinemataceae cyanobacterium]